jgi:hypothetical protein
MKLFSNALPWATIGLFALTLIYALVGGAIVIWGDPGALSFNEYGDKLVWFAGAFGVLGVGRGIAAAKKPTKK